MPYIVRDTASSLLEAWSKYKLKEWMSMAIGGIIFIVGYVLGTMSWRKGSARIFVVLDILAGTAGFFYFCYKGLQIFAEAHDEIMAIICSSLNEPEGRHTHRAVENDYVSGRAILDHIHESKLHTENTFTEDNAHEDLDYLEFYPYRGSTFDLEHHANNHTSSGKVKSNLCGKIHSSRSAPDISYIKAAQQNVDFALRGRANEDPLSDNSLYTAQGSRYGEQSSEPSHNCHGISEDSRSFEHQGSYPQKSPSVMSSESLSRNRGGASNLVSGSGGRDHVTYDNYQRPFHGAFSESMLLNVRNDFTQYYQVPKTLSISSSFLESPDPCRHLKPKSFSRKPLPSVPSQEDAFENSKEIENSMTKEELHGSRVPTYYRPENELPPPDRLPVLSHCPKSLPNNGARDGNIISSLAAENPSNNLAQNTNLVPRPGLEQSPASFSHDPGNDSTSLVQNENSASRSDLELSHQSFTSGPETVSPMQWANHVIRPGLEESPAPSYHCLENNLVKIKKNKILPRLGLEPSPCPSHFLKNDIRNRELAENDTPAGEQYFASPQRPPRLETPLPILELPANQLHVPTRTRSLLQPRLSLPANYIFLPTVSSQLRSPQPFRCLTPVARYKSHPLTTYTCPPSSLLPHQFTARPTSRSSSGSPESPAPKKRPSPLQNGKSYSSPRNTSQSPPTIPRKMRSRR